MVGRFPPLRPEDPKQVATYALRARLGSGGMGNVYLSFSPGGFPLAIKVVKRAFADDPEFRVRFRREIAAALRVQGYYTAPVRDAGPVSYRRLHAGSQFCLTTNDSATSKTWVTLVTLKSLDKISDDLAWTATAWYRERPVS